MKEVYPMNKDPVRLQKIENETHFDIMGTINRYAPYILVALIIILMLLIIALIIAIAQAGGGNITMVESGNYYYHLQDVI